MQVCTNIITPEKMAASGTEHGHQAALFLWAIINRERLPMLKWMHAIPNGGGRSIVTATNLKAEGVKSGVSDVFLPYAMKTALNTKQAGAGWIWKHGLYIEMKKPKRGKKEAGKTSNKQDEFRDDMRAAGYACAVCFTWVEASETIEAYLRGEIA